MDKVIEANLMKTFSEEQIAQFYSTFADSEEKYKKIDADAVEVLFGFLDFQKFKESVIKFKKSASTDEKSSDQTNNGSEIQDIKEDMFFELVKEDVKDKSLGWSKVIE